MAAFEAGRSYEIWFVDSFSWPGDYFRVFGPVPKEIAEAKLSELIKGDRFNSNGDAQVRYELRFIP